MNTPAVVLINPKYGHNLAGVIRACSCFGVNQLFYTGDRIEIPDDTYHTWSPERSLPKWRKIKSLKRLPREERMKGYSSVEWIRNDFPLSGQGTPVCVELLKDSEPLSTFRHPEDAIYVFGPEDGGVTKSFRVNCFRFLHVPAHHCLNLAAAVNVVLAHRFMQLNPVLPLGEILRETRGEIDIDGWEGK